ncbi:MAG: AAA family ATPase [Planctomycetota bacterium]|jgi:ATP-dependent Clp protease ATP-binding subunit ClpC|nr:AAA family ATPase [Planctomycetota bacterium]
MIRAQTSVVLKYIEKLDRFVKIRTFDPEAVQQLLKIDEESVRKSDYYHLVVTACVVGYNDQILPEIRQRSTQIGDIEAVEEELYHASVALNPGLDIRKVVLPVQNPSKSSSQIHLFERAEPQSESLVADWIDVENLEERVSRRIIGQEEAVGRVSLAIRKAAAGLRGSNRPISSFFFVGQTGVGKTELARVLARTLWSEEAEHLVKIDCSEYSLHHEYAKLIGAPPGYIGHEEGGVLTEAMKRLGKAVVLFDEIEKADRKVHNVLLQILDEGVVTDSHGARIPFDRSVIILTSNLGVEEVQEMKNRIGFGSPTELDQKSRFGETLRALRKEFRPEFLNRVDDLILFNLLDAEACEKIVRLFLDELVVKATKRGIDLTITQPAARFLAESGYSREYGARELRREVQKQVEEPLAERILDGRLERGQNVQVGLRGEALSIRIDNS